MVAFTFGAGLICTISLFSPSFDDRAMTETEVLGLTFGQREQLASSGGVDVYLDRFYAVSPRLSRYSIG